MYEKTFTHKLTKIVVDVMLYGGIICLLLIPFFAKFARGVNNEKALNYYVVVLSLFFSGIFAIYILFNLKLMFKTLLTGNPFVNKNITCFRKIAVSCFIIAIIYIIKCFFIYSLATVIVVLVFMIGCLFCLTLKDIFKQAIYYKEENDWTV